MSGVTVYTTTGSQWNVPNGTSFTQEVTPTGELAVLVFGADGETALFACGSVEAVYTDGSASNVTDGARRTGL